MRRPLSESSLPAAQAIRGREGIFDGLDHRGHEVIAALKPVPFTGWFLIAKTDHSEALATGRLIAWLIIALTIGAAIAAYYFAPGVQPLVKELPMEYAVELNRLIELQMEGSIG